MGRKLLKIGHALNPRDPVLLQSLALLEYKYTTANLARVMFKRASELDPRHQPVWMVRIPYYKVLTKYNVISYVWGVHLIISANRTKDLSSVNCSYC